VLHDSRKEEVEDLKKAAEEEKAQLSLDWVDEAGEDENFLRKAVDGKSKSKREMAIDFMGSILTPFVSSATAIGSLFPTLLKEHQDTMFKAMAKNDIVSTEAQFNKVHVGFFDPKEGRRELSTSRQ